jgi:hypothetical protein
MRYEILDEQTDECEWYTFTEGGPCKLPTNKVIVHWTDEYTPFHEAHLCDEHITRGFELATQKVTIKTILKDKESIGILILALSDYVYTRKLTLTSDALSKAEKIEHLLSVEYLNL